ncbi:hypothetical protein [Phosphitispora sp. TUW77]|uniref:hypothetical protein n=1 Tax=Phosphitispora sp. TUW77 TaxID=3152361 RepID=UPI003AB19A60
MRKKISDSLNNKFIVRADYYGDIPSNQKGSFWVPQSKGMLCFSNEQILYRERTLDDWSLELDFKKIIKVRMISLNPSKNMWASRCKGNPFYFLFWNPLWNRYLLNVTYYGNTDRPRELFFKLKTGKITLEAVGILKKMIEAGVSRSE